MFNRKIPNVTACRGGICGSAVHVGNDHSYMFPIRWDNFVDDVSGYIDHAMDINSNIDDYELVKVVL